MDNKQSRIMYVEYKDDDVAGAARIGRVTFSKTGKTVTYRGKQLQTLRGDGYKANYFDVETGEHYWVSGCRKDGNDPLYPDVVEIDEDVQQEYWTEIRGLPGNVGTLQFRAPGKHSKGGRNTK